MERISTISKGKHCNTATCASARKLIRIIWAVGKIKSYSKFHIKKNYDLKWSFTNNRISRRLRVMIKREI
ncbi:MAG TPA: hypothetical protein PLC35_04350 [Methanosarcina vacuolata]|nr:hypothetical protein [Methanosarcina vacuolata]